MYLGHTFKTSL